MAAGVESELLMVKEHVVEQSALRSGWLWGSLMCSLLATLAIAGIEHALPEALNKHEAPPDQFIADNAYEHLVNLTSIGPRVAGSYENEVLAIREVSMALKEATRSASPHNRIDFEAHSADGAFALDFFDGMNNVYRGVQMVVARVSGKGGDRIGRDMRQPTLLLNCHYDTVPDSPGASDDGAGCAVLLEVARALAASPYPLRAPLLFLFNGAEENILQASHGFVTTHRWAKSVRAFINIEACGAGGREVLFQAGPRDPWIMEVYAESVPRPFASSLAQELFQSGLIPADTDYRIFRDFGNLSGVDLAWSANGYVYHTHLDTADRVPRGALQRTGDNVLALVHGLLKSEEFRREPEHSSGQPVFFDLLGVVVICVRTPTALLLAAATFVLVVVDVQAGASEARIALCVRRTRWWKGVIATMFGWAQTQTAGVLAAVVVALVLHVLGARLTFYARPWLLAPLYGAPALAASWAIAGRSLIGAPWGLRGWWKARAWQQASSLWATGAMIACVAAGLRSGFLPLLWALGGSLADLLPGARGGGRNLAMRWIVGATLPALLTCYLALGSLRMFVPVMGRAGSGPIPADVLMAVLVSGLVLSTCSWMLPLVVATKDPSKLVLMLAGTCAAACVLVLASPLSSVYSPEQPQRLMLFDVRRDIYESATSIARSEHFYWAPVLEANTERTLRLFFGLEVRPVNSAECVEWPYCGLPYFLPVLSLVPGSIVVPAPADAPGPRASLNVRTYTEPVNDTIQLVRLEIEGPKHVVIIVSLVSEGTELSWSSVVHRPRPVRGVPPPTYFFALYEAHAPAKWQLDMHVLHKGHGHVKEGTRWARVSIAGHTMSGPGNVKEEHGKMLNGLPRWTAPTGWAVHMRLHHI